MANGAKKAAAEPVSPVLVPERLGDQQHKRTQYQHGKNKKDPDVNLDGTVETRYMPGQPGCAAAPSWARPEKYIRPGPARKHHDEALDPARVRKCGEIDEPDGHSVGTAKQNGASNRFMSTGAPPTLTKS